MDTGGGRERERAHVCGGGGKTRERIIRNRETNYKVKSGLKMGFSSIPPSFHA